MTSNKGRIIKSIGGFYYVLFNNSLITCRARGKFRNDKVTPLVGDIVTFDISSDNSGYITDIDKRKNKLLRPKVANIDYNIIVTSVKSPNFSSKLLDKSIILNENFHVNTIIILSKLDLLDGKELNKIENIKKYYRNTGYLIYTNSKEDISILKNILKNKFVSVSGQSGAGKSTFINNLSDRKLKLKTGEISFVLGRGKHTTRHIEFYNIDGFYIADTPGFSSLDISLLEKQDLKFLFKEFKNFNCKFKLCNHINEPGCELKKFLKTNLENSYLKERYNNYKNIMDEIEKGRRRY